MPKKPASMIELGRTGLNWSAGYIYDEFLSQLRFKSGVRTYREMQDNDPIMGATIHAIKQILRESRWSVKVGEGGKEEDRQFLLDNMNSMTHSWMDFYTESLSMLTYGWAYFETVFRRAANGSIMWKKHAIRKQISLERWILSDTGEMLGLEQRPAPDYKLITLPISKCLHFRTEPNGNNPEGRSVLRSAYKPWYFKKNIETIEAIGLERDLTGLPKITLPEGVDPESEDTAVQAQIEAAKRVIANVRRDEQEGLLVPYGWEFDLVSSPGTRQFDTTAVINRYNKEMAVTILAQFIMLGMERTGSYALAEQQTDMFYLSLEGWIDSFTTQFNRVAVPRLFALNGVVDRKALPFVVHTPIRRLDLKDISQYVSDLTGVDALELDDDLKGFLKNYAHLTEFSDVKK